ncbi:expressed unknown protein [Seminavis robusta]|uniref:Uncharacterized protein n=1 Tax=Seminavis robusta TaxID=568900 RepID=A0A9N8DHE5_9STRA|nr:expressed unknown protein [Seminavis robusta]|eukprot:Sro146_g067630.1 n/a (204) ;mRNA; f:74991-75602
MTVMSQINEFLCLVFYAALLLVTLATLTATFINYHLFPLDTDNLAWSNAWLLAYVIDYYGVCLCFCGVIVATEAVWWTAMLWSCSCLVVGSPACCLYIFLWITKEGGTLRLERSALAMEMLAAAAAAANHASNEQIHVTPILETQKYQSPASNKTGSKRHHDDHRHTRPPQRHQHHNHKSRHSSRSRSHSRSRGHDVERAVVL